MKLDTGWRTNRPQTDERHPQIEMRGRIYKWNIPLIRPCSCRFGTLTDLRLVKLKAATLTFIFIQSPFSTIPSEEETTNSSSAKHTITRELLSLLFCLFPISLWLHELHTAFCFSFYMGLLTIQPMAMQNLWIHASSDALFGDLSIILSILFVYDISMQQVPWKLSACLFFRSLGV